MLTFDIISLHHSAFDIWATRIHLCICYAGVALKYVYDKVITSDSGMRRNVPKVIVAVTDGRSQDEVQKNAAKLQHAGKTLTFCPTRLHNYSLGHGKILHMNRVTISLNSRHSLKCYYRFSYKHFIVFNLSETRKHQSLLLKTGLEVIV